MTPRGKNTLALNEPVLSASANQIFRCVKTKHSVKLVLFAIEIKLQNIRILNFA